MSENPFAGDAANDILAQLRLEIDAADANEQVASVDDKLQEVGTTVDKINAQADSLASTFKAAQDQIIQSLTASNDQLGTFNDQLNQTEQTMTRLQAFREGVGPGAPAGFFPQPPPETEQPTTDQILNGVGGEDIGGLYGVARGLRAGAGIGRIAGASSASTAGLSGAADVIYLEQAFSKLEDILPNINAALTPVIEQIPLFGEGLVALPFGAILTTVLALAGPLLAVADILQRIEQNAAAAKESADQQITNDQQKNDFEKQTSAELQAGAAKTKDDYTSLIASSNDVYNGIKQAISQLPDMTPDVANKILEGLTATDTSGKRKPDFSALESFYGTALNSTTTPAIEEAASKLADMTNKLKENVQTQFNYADALQSDTVKTNDAAEALRKHLETQDQLAKQFAADDTMTTAQIQKHADESAAQINTIEANIKALQDENATRDLSQTEIQKNNDAIQTYQNQLSLLVPEYEHLTSTSLALAQTRDQEKLTTEDLKKSVDEYVKDLKEADTVQQTINNDLAKWAQDDQALQVQRQQQTLDQTTAFNQQEADTEEQYQEQRLGKTQAFADSIEQIQDKAATQQAKDIVDNQVQQLQALQNYNAKIADINSQAQLSELDAAQNLDARKLVQDQEKQQDQINKATQQYNLESERRKEAEDRKLADLAASENKEIAQKTEAFQRQLAADDQKDEERQERDKQRFDAQQLRQQEQWKKEDDARDLQRQQELTALDQHLTNVQNAQQQAWDQILKDTTVSTSTLTNIVNTAMQNMTTAAQQMLANLQSYAAAPQGMTTNPYGPVTTNNAPTLGPSPDLSTYFGENFGGLFAEGGTVPGMSAEDRYIIAGDKGAELLKVPGGTQVYNNQQTSQILGGRSVQMTNHFTLNDVGKRSDAEIIALAEQGVVSALDKALAELEGKQL